MEKISIGYIGSSFGVAESINNSIAYELKLVICEKPRAGKELILFCELFNIKLVLIVNAKELETIILDYAHEVENYIMCYFGIIISKSILESVSIFNLHPGDLKTHRGRHPVERALLNNESHAEITLYKISDKIDLGEYIYSRRVNISAFDDNVSVLAKLESQIPFLLRKLCQYLKGSLKGKLIDEGRYEPRVKEEDFTLDIENDSLADIYNKIRSQARYNGAVLKHGNDTYWVFAISSIEPQDTIEPRLNNILICEDRIYFLKAGYKIGLSVHIKGII